MIRKAPGIGVMLVNHQAALMIEQSVEDMGRFASGRGNYLRVVRPKTDRMDECRT